MKKNLNCGTPDIEPSELGVMCPATCVGYNDCQMTESGEIIRKVAPAPTEEDLADEKEDNDGGDDTTDDGNFETNQQNLALKTENVDCKDEDGFWLNHMGKYRLCRWFFTNEFEVAEKKKMNCGITGTLLAVIKPNLNLNR